TPTDAQAIAVLRYKMFEDLGRHATDPARFIQDSAETFAALLASGTCEVWLAEADDKAVATLALLFYPRLPSPESSVTREGYIVNVYTEREWRGRGIAGALVDTAIITAKQLGFGRVRLHPSAEGQPLYAAAGFLSRFDEMELTLPPVLPHQR